MHLVFIIGSIAASIGYVFGEHAARMFVAALLGVGALAVCGLIVLVACDMNRPPRTTTVHMGSK